MRIRPAFVRLSFVLGVLVWLGIGICEEAAARAGGAGGRSSSRSRSSRSSSSGSSKRWSSGSSSSKSYRSSGSSSYRSGGSSGSYSGGSSDAILTALKVLVVIVVLGWIAYVIIRRISVSHEPAPLLPSHAPAQRTRGLDAFLSANPDFDPAIFANKVRAAFIKIQVAWTAQDISGVRRFISDGMYQRFATQFRMMGLLKQRNVLDQVRIHGVQPVEYRIDSEFDAIDVWVSASMSDSFTCELDPSMNTEGSDPFVEYWSFIRKRGAGGSSFDLFVDEACPSCGAALPEAMGELCRCAHCQVLVNSGEFDWVLAEITQEADYGRDGAASPRVSPGLRESIAILTDECPDFSRQVVEDKASNAFMQIMTAHATRNPASVRRFVSDDLFGELSAKILKSERNIIFNRIYLNKSVLLDVAGDETKHWLAIGLSASMQRAEILPGGSLRLLDAAERRRDYILNLERDIAAVPEKGSLYQHQCASCGGAVGDTLDVNCQFCGTALNSTRHEWIVCGFQAG